MFSLFVFFLIRLSRSIPNEWIITAILTSIGALAYNTGVQVTEDFKEPLFLYSIIAGLPSTKKSRCIRLIKEEFQQLSEDACTLNNSKF